MDYTPGFGVKKSPLAKMTASHGTKGMRMSAVSTGKRLGEDEP